MAQYQHMESALIHGGIYGDKTTGHLRRQDHRCGQRAHLSDFYL